MAEVICFGELLMRLSPPGFQRMVQTESLEVVYGGAEANAAVALGGFGVETAFVSKVPGHELGDAVINALRRYGVITKEVLRGGERLGLYYLEKGASQRPSKVIYDRKHSAIAESNPSEYQWKSIMKGAKWFHFTGITPALSPNMEAATQDALMTAKALGLTVSCDINYRSTLWTIEKAKSVMKGLMPYVDVCMVNEEHARQIFGIEADSVHYEQGRLTKEGYIQIAKKLIEKFGFKKVVLTLRSSTSALEHQWAAMLYDGKEAYFSRTYPIHVIDRVGAGDAFAGSLIYATLQEYEVQEAVEFATAASCLKHSIEGDFNHVTLSEVNALLSGDGSGRIQR